MQSTLIVSIVYLLPLSNRPIIILLPPPPSTYALRAGVSGIKDERQDNLSNTSEYNYNTTRVIQESISLSLHLIYLHSIPISYLYIYDTYRKCKFPMNLHFRLLVGWSFGWLISWSVCRGFQKGWEVTSPYSYRSTIGWWGCIIFASIKFKYERLTP